MFIIVGGKGGFHCGREKSVSLWAGKECFIACRKRVFIVVGGKRVFSGSGRQINILLWAGKMLRWQSSGRQRSCKRCNRNSG